MPAAKLIAERTSLFAYSDSMPPAETLGGMVFSVHERPPGKLLMTCIGFVGPD